ncbi:MAG: NeuD/PglB/VioB family sugar acetyltransferase [bacterium]|nr:NeuD/PglB/VioB family sugar acetyltransferase [bacterium]
MVTLKRLIDIIISVTGLALTAPLLLTAAILIKLDSKGPVFFCQERIGQGGRPFKIIKFRTMTAEAAKEKVSCEVCPGDSRLTRSGKLLRATDIDEIPQLINVLKGEMSLVGPRPTIKEQVDNYTPNQRRRLEVKPGITGWAQVNGRIHIPWEERIKLDLEYIDRQSLLFDLKILIKTIWVVLEGVTAREHCSSFGPVSQFTQSTKSTQSIEGSLQANMDSVIIYGASGHARVIIDILEKSGPYRIAGLLDDDNTLWGRQIYGYEVLGGGDMLVKLSLAGVKKGIVAVGENKIRCQLARKMVELRFDLIKAIHPSAQIARGVMIKAGSAIMAGVVINADSILGENVIINTAATIDHDNRIADGVHICPGAHLAGGVSVGRFSRIGIGAAVIQGIMIGEDVIIGANAAVIRNIPDYAVAVGVPARVIKIKK